MTKKLRSQAWFGGVGRDAFIHRSWMKVEGHPDVGFDGRPVIGICNTFSELTPCNAHFRQLAEYVKRGVREAGGLPLEGRKLHLEVSDAELETRRKDWQPPRAAMAGGYQRLYVDHVMQADQGADFDFLLGCRGCAAPQRESH
jgi:dihydroxyacid dehydratase/phosphogluconate dehydratase